MSESPSPPPSTAVDPTRIEWSIDDAVVALRFEGSRRTLDLTAAPAWTLGAAPTCSLHLEDPTGRVSRRHAALERTSEGWQMRDLGSTNGVRHNRERRRTFFLLPGDVIELGGLRLIAESAGLRALHALLQRFVGWSEPQQGEIDRALLAVRETAHLRGVLLLCGDGPLEGVVRRLHRAMLADRPLVHLGPKERGVAGVERATNGLLHVAAARLPRDTDQMLAGLRMPDARVRLVLTADAPSVALPAISRLALVTLPSLRTRRAELPDLILAYAADACAELGLASSPLLPRDPDWLIKSGLDTLDEVELHTLRLVATRAFGLSGAAKRFGLSPSALSHWSRRRSIPV